MRRRWSRRDPPGGAESCSSLHLPPLEDGARRFSEPNHHGQRLVARTRRERFRGERLQPGGFEPRLYFAVGEPEPAMGVLFPQELEIVGGEVSDQDPPTGL